jgi:ribulose-5-phosphate 4-epimerase/fuculose-1-phosphate aldolase
LSVSEKRENLLGIHQELDDLILDLAFLSSFQSDTHPANTGDVSQVLSPELGNILVNRFRSTLSNWFQIEHVEGLASIRNDGRTGYRSEGIREEKYFQVLHNLTDRVFLITRTGAQIPAIQHSIDVGQDGELLNIVQLDKTGRQIRIVYGAEQYGSIPSIEMHIHMFANALGMIDGCSRPATVHAHPYHLVLLGRHRLIQGNFQKFNSLIYSQIEGLNRNYTELIGIVPYFPSGSESLVLNTMETLRRHKLVLWMNHGLLVREANIRRAYTLMAYAEESAKAALDTLKHGAKGLPDDWIGAFLEDNALLDFYKELERVLISDESK